MKKSKFIHPAGLGQLQMLLAITNTESVSEILAGQTMNVSCCFEARKKKLDFSKFNKRHCCYIPIFLLTLLTTESCPQCTETKT